MDLPTSSLHSMYKRSHSYCLVDLLIVGSEATREEFPLNVCECSDMFPKDLPCMSPIRDLSSRRPCCKRIAWYGSPFRVPPTRDHKS